MLADKLKQFNLGHFHDGLLSVCSEELWLKPQSAPKFGNTLSVDAMCRKGRVWESEKYDATITEFSETQLKNMEKFQGLE